LFCAFLAPPALSLPHSLATGHYSEPLATIPSHSPCQKHPPRAAFWLGRRAGRISHRIAKVTAENHAIYKYDTKSTGGFASILLYLDPSSSGALCTRELLELLAGRGMDCRVLTTGILDPEQWVEHVQRQVQAGDLQAAQNGSAVAGLEEGLWLCPIEDRRKLGSPREGMLEGFSLGNDLLLVDYTGRLFREGKAVISA
jgi:hypothetical protein